MPAHHRSPDRQTDGVLLNSSPPHHSKLSVPPGTEEEKEVKLQMEMEPPVTTCSRLVAEQEEEEKQQPEHCAVVVKEDSDFSSRGAVEEELPEYFYIDLQVIRKEVQCPICLGIIKKTRTVMECLHRFCRECIDKSMRMGNNECPACRTHCASRRSLRDDPRYDALIAALFPDVEKYEAEELAFCEEDKTRNKLASIAQIFKRQSEALGKKRSSRKGTSRRNIRETPSRKSKRKRSGKTESDDDEDLENAEGQTSSYSGEQYKELEHRHTARKRIGSSYSFSPATSSGGVSMENKLEHKRSYPGIMWNIEMQTWGKNGARSGHVRRNQQPTHLTKFTEFLQNSEKKDDESLTSKTPSGADMQVLAANEPSQDSYNNQSTLLPSNIDDKGRLSEVVDQFRDRLQLSEEKKTLPGFEANGISHGGQLILACQQKETL